MALSAGSRGLIRVSSLVSLCPWADRGEGGMSGRGETIGPSEMKE